MNSAQLTRRFVAETWGGTETVVLETSRRLVAKGHPTEILCSNALASRDREEIGGIRVSRYSYFYPYLGLDAEAKQRLDLKGGNLFSFHLMHALARRAPMDLIHLHTGKRMGAIGRYIAKKRNIPYVVSLHGGVHDVPAEEAKSWTEPTAGSFEWGKALGFWVGSRRVLEDADAILCVGQAEARAVSRRLPENRVVHMPNGVDAARFASGLGERFRKRYAIASERRILLTVGRIDPQKNQLLAVEALKELLKLDPRWHLLLVGHVTDHAYGERLVQTMRRHGLEQHVTLIEGLDAASSDLQDAYAAADVFLLPSTHEPFGIVILEAWAAGLPVVASRTGGIPSFVEDGVDGLLFTPGDIEEGVRRLSTLNDNHALQERLGKNGNVKARTHYDWDVVTDRLLKLYEEVIDAHSIY